MTLCTTPGPENRSTPSKGAQSVARMMLIEQAAGFLGQAALASALGIEERSLRRKFGNDRGVSDDNLIDAADAMEARAAHIVAQAAKMRALVA